MEPRQQVLLGLFLGLTLVAIGIVRGYRRGRIGFSTAIEYGYVLKLILGSLACAAALISLVLTLIFIVNWGLHADVPGAPPASLETFIPVGYPVHYVMGLVGAGALCIFALALIGYLDHINTG